MSEVTALYFDASDGVDNEEALFLDDLLTTKLKATLNGDEYDVTTYRYPTHVVEIDGNYYYPLMVKVDSDYYYVTTDDGKLYESLSNSKLSTIYAIKNNVATSTEITLTGLE